MVPDLPPDAQELTLDRLVGDWRVFQLRRGHRFSTDDMVCAWRASRSRPDAVRLLDLGSGVGSVGLCTLWRLGRPVARLVGVEAQQVSLDLARRTVQLNGLGDRVEYVHGDLRDPAVLPSEARFDLITGTPPYVPVGHGVVSPVPQRAAARIELRGSVFDYCEAARRWLAPGGRFCFAMAAGDGRAERAPDAHGLVILERYDYLFRHGSPPRIVTMVCARHEDGPFPARATGCLTIRGPDGEWTPEYQDLRAEMGPTTADSPS